MTCPCGPGWRVETARLSTGVVQGRLPVFSFTVQNLLNKAGTGTFTMHPKDVGNLRNVWPDMTSLWVTYYGKFVWAGYVRTIGIEAGTFQIGCDSLDGYLNRRKLRDELVYANTQQTLIGSGLVEHARLNGGIPLFGAALTSTQKRDRTYEPWDRKNIGEAVQQLTEVIDGPDWRMSAERLGGAWYATMTFADQWLVERDYVLVSDSSLHDYRLDIDTQTHATLIDAIGSGEEQDMLIATAYDAEYPAGASPYPRFDEAPAFKDITDAANLQAAANGWLDNSREPTAIPRGSIMGKEAIQELDLDLGDTITARMCFHGIRYEGLGRVVGETWKADPEQPPTRELLLTPLDRPSIALLDQPSCNPCVDCED